jgi:hypothetical protein
MKQLPNIARGDGPQAQNRAATITTQILGIVRHALLAWWHRDHTPILRPRALRGVP